MPLEFQACTHARQAPRASSRLLRRARSGQRRRQWQACAHTFQLSLPARTVPHAGYPPDIREKLKGQMLDSCAASVERVAGLAPGVPLPLARLLERLKIDVPMAGKRPRGMPLLPELRRGRAAG